MKKNRKWLVMLLCAVMILGTLTGCGSSGNANEGSAGGGNSKAASSADSVLKTGVLRVGMECGYAPYNWTQSDDSNGAVPIAGTKDYAYGYDVMMAKKLADELGYEVEIHKIDWDSLPPALQSGKVDCVIAGQSITAERQKTVDFTEPYYYADVVGLVKADGAYANAASVADLAGVKATSQLNTIWYDCLDQIDNVNKLPAMEDVPKMLVALDTDKVDFVCCDMPTAMAAVIAYPGMKVVEFSENDGFEVSDEDVNIGISVQKGNTELVEQLNSVLSGMTEADFESMMEEATKVQPLSDSE